MSLVNYSAQDYLVGKDVAYAYSHLPEVDRLVVNDRHGFPLADTYKLGRIGRPNDAEWEQAKILATFDFGNEIYLQVDYAIKNPFPQNILDAGRKKGFTPAGIMRGYLSRRELLEAELEKLGCQSIPDIIKAVEDCYSIKLNRHGISPKEEPKKAAAQEMEA